MFTYTYYIIIIMDTSIHNNIIMNLHQQDDIEMEKRERKFVHTRKRKNEKAGIYSTNGEQTRLRIYSDDESIDENNPKDNPLLRHNRYQNAPVLKHNQNVYDKIPKIDDAIEENQCKTIQEISQHLLSSQNSNNHSMQPHIMTIRHQPNKQQLNHQTMYAQKKRNPPPKPPQRFYFKTANSTNNSNANQQQEQFQQRPRLPAPSPSTNNPNQVSKMATNLINDIYEKHLLNQTTFEQSSQHFIRQQNNQQKLSSPQTNTIENNNLSIRQQQQQNYLMQQHQHQQQKLRYQREHTQQQQQNQPKFNAHSLNSHQLQNKSLIEMSPNKLLTNNVQLLDSQHKYNKQRLMQKQYQLSKLNGNIKCVNGNSDIVEPHIYEMIDDCKMASDNPKINFHLINEIKPDQNVNQHNAIVTRTKPQINIDQQNDNGYLSHLPHYKRMSVMLETAQALANAAYIEKAAQRMVSAASSTKQRTSEGNGSERGGFCGALQRTPPPLPAALARRLSNKENVGFGRVKVMLRVSDNPPEGEENSSYLSIDKKKRQVTLSDTTTNQASQSSTTAAQERGPMVSAPKMFAFDGLFTTEDNQNDVCGSALSEVIPAVLEGSDGCLLALGYPGAGQNRTMLGSVGASSDLGAIPCAISWLYKGINEKRQKSGARFSVRVSALGVNATKPGSSGKDLLAALATESDDSPGIYLRDDFLGGPTELRAPTAERAALFLDAALSGRTSSVYEPALIFTLHVYQYSLAGKGGVAGGRSRLHLIDLGGCANRSGGLPLSGVGNVVLSILSGQRHPPNREHPLTPLLKDCLAPLTCHVAIIAHVSHAQTHADSLTTIQLASRIHRLRRRKHRFPLSGDKGLGGNNGHSGSGSSGPDPSSSDFSADTVIYVGPCADDATDNEHPPVFLPSLNSGDNRCAMNKVLRGSAAEKPSAIKSPMKKSTAQKPQSPSHPRTDSLKRNQVPSSSNITQSASDHTIYTQIMVPSNSTPKIVAGALKHAQSVSRGSNIPTPKGSPMRRNPGNGQESPSRQITEEKWIDGPRVSKFKVAEARHLLREINHVKQCETWIDGPNTNPPPTTGLPTSSNPNGNYGYMDSHKKTMIRQWVENQTSQIFQPTTTTATTTTVGTSTCTSTNTASNSSPVQYRQFYLAQQKNESNQCRNEDDHSSIGSKNEEFVSPLAGGFSNIPTGNTNCAESLIKTGLKQSTNDNQSEKSASNVSENRLSAVGCCDQEEEDQDSGPSEVPPALPLIDPLGSREISHESVHLLCSRHVSRESLSQNILMMDCALQVTEDDIAKAMGEHPLAALSHGDVSVVSSFNVGDTFSECLNTGDTSRNQFDQLARLRELFTSQLAMAEVVPAFRIGDASSVYSEPAFRFNAGPSSVCSEPAYRPPSPRCRDCRQSISRTPSQSSLPSLNGIVAISGMEPYASLRHPDGASDPNIKKSLEIHHSNDNIEIHIKENPLAELCETELNKGTPLLSQKRLPHLPLLPVSTPEAYDSGHDSTPRASKHSGISRRAESGYHSVATVRDSDESSFGSSASRSNQKPTKKKNRQDKSLCQWLRNPFTCTYPDTEGEVSDF